MAKDDYDVIVCRILVYLYACLKRKKIFNEPEFFKSIVKNVNSEEYLIDILRMMAEEKLISGAEFAGTWGADCIMLTEYCEMKVTANGIHYLQENGKMKMILQTLKDTADTVAVLAELLGLFL